MASLTKSVRAYLSLPTSLATVSPFAAATAIVIFIAAIAVALLRARSRVMAAAGVALTLIVIIALATVFPNPDGVRDGWRVFHLVSLGVAIIAAAAAISMNWIGRLAVVAAFISLAVWQRAVVEEWRVASNAMIRLQLEIKRIGEASNANDYALLAVPDALGRVPFGRNAQGGLLLAYSGDRERISQMILATDDTIREWKMLSDEGAVRKLTTRPDAPAAPTVFYCFDGERLVHLGFWRSSTQSDWDTRWSRALRANCPTISYR